MNLRELITARSLDGDVEFLKSATVMNLSELQGGEEAYWYFRRMLQNFDNKV